MLERYLKCLMALSILLGLNPHARGSQSLYLWDTLRTELNVTETPLNLVPLTRIYTSPRSMELKEALANFSEFRGRKSLSFGHTESQVWAAFSLANTSSKPIKLFLRLHNPRTSKATLYHVNDKNQVILSMSAGLLVPMSQRVYPDEDLVFPLTWQPGEHKNLVIQAYSNAPLRISPKLYSQEDFFQTEEDFRFFAGSYLGVIICMFLYNLIIFFYTREKTYLFYVAFVGCLEGFGLTGLLGVTDYYLWPESTFWQERSQPAFTAIGLFLGTLFCREFIGTKKIMPRLDRLLLICAAPLPIMAILSFVDLRLLRVTYYLPIIVCLISTSVYGTAKGSRTALIYLLSWTPLLLGGTAIIFAMLGFLPTNTLTSHGVYVGAALECIILAIGLADRINTLRKDRERERQLSTQKLRAANDQLSNMLEATQAIAHCDSPQKSLEAALGYFDKLLCIQPGETILCSLRTPLGTFQTLKYRAGESLELEDSWSGELEIAKSHKNMSRSCQISDNALEIACWRQETLFCHIRIETNRFRENQQMFALIDTIADELATALDALDSMIRLKSQKTSLEEEVAHRNQELANAHRIMLESISCARTIQLSSLPKEEDVKKWLPNSMILWQPRDLVGGDVYWFRQTKEACFIGVLDCIGHGVPGALVSVKAQSILDQAFYGVSDKSPHDILRRMHALMLSTNHRESDASVEHRLDIGICRIDSQGVHFAGAHIDLHFVEDGQVESIRGNHHSLGDSRLEINELRTKTVHASKKASFYILTDGYFQQCGGAKNLPFGKRRLIEVLRECENKGFHHRKQVFSKRQEEYRRSTLQLDDVTIIGFSLDQLVVDDAA